MQLEDGDIVQVCLLGTWRYLPGPSWKDTEAFVICRQLTPGIFGETYRMMTQHCSGLAEPYQYPVHTDFMNAARMVNLMQIMQSVQISCTGMETEIRDCTLVSMSEASSSVAAVECTPGLYGNCVNS